MQEDILQPIDGSTPALQASWQSNVLSEEEIRWSKQALIAGLFMGLVGHLLFYFTRPGINILLFFTLFTFVSFVITRYAEKSIGRIHALFAIPVLITSAFLAINLSGILIMFNLWILIGSLLIFVRFLTTKSFLGENHGSLLPEFLSMFLIVPLEGTFTILHNAAAGIDLKTIAIAKNKTSIAILRGFMLATPIIIVFGLLLSSADLIFQNWLQIFVPDSFEDIEYLLVQSIFFFLLAWICISLFRIMIVGMPDLPSTMIEAPHDRKAHKPFRVSIIETSIVLGSIDLMFLLFVGIQATYLFGGESNIDLNGYTYAEYARRGFFELVLVSILTFGLILVMDSITERNAMDAILFQSLSIGLILLTLVLLIAAFMRMELYIDAFGFTHLRVMTGVFIGWLGLVFLLLIASLLSGKRQWLISGVILLGFCYPLTLNAMNLDAFIAQENIERFHETDKLDLAYLMTLSDDAVPALVTLLDAENFDDTQRETLLHELGTRLHGLDIDRENRSVVGFHLSKNRAWQALNDVRDDLDGYIDGVSR